MMAATTGEGSFLRSELLHKYENYSDAELMEMATLAGGNLEALTAVFERYRAVLLRFAQWYVHDDAEDIIEDLYLKFARNPPKYNSKAGEVISYFAKCCTNACLDHTRKRRKEVPSGHSQTEENDLPDFLTEGQSTQPLSLASLLNEALRKDFRKCLEAMTNEKPGGAKLNMSHDAKSALYNRIAKLMLEAFKALVEGQSCKYKWPELKILLEMYMEVSKEGANTSRMQRLLEAMKKSIRACMEAKGYGRMVEPSD